MRARLAAWLLVVLLMALGARGAAATGRDFLDETLIAATMKPGEFGLELAADARFDRDYRLQGWFSPALEVGLTSRLLVEAGGSFLNRGSGAETGGDRAEVRLNVADAARWPLDAALSIEYEDETRAAKRLALERIATPRLVLTREWPSAITTTANVGVQRRYTPVPRGGVAYAFGVRGPERRPLMLGVELRHERLEHSTRISPQLWIAIPREMTLRIGGSFGTHPRPYRFIARAILETEF